MTKHFFQDGAAADMEWMCGTCGKQFTTRQALGAHQGLAHKVRHPGWAAADATACKVCGVEFWTRKRLVDHFKTAGRGCLACLEVPSGQADAAAVNAAAHRQHAKDNAAAQYAPAMRPSTETVSAGVFGQGRHQAVAPPVGSSESSNLLPTKLE